MVLKYWFESVIKLEFSQGISHGFGQIFLFFFIFFFLKKEKMFHDILDKKQTFADYKNIDFR